MRKKDDKVGDKTHGYTKKEGGQREKKEREKALKDRNMRAKKKEKKKGCFLTSNKLFELYKFKFFWDHKLRWKFEPVERSLNNLSAFGRAVFHIHKAIQCYGYFAPSKYSVWVDLYFLLPSGTCCVSCCFLMDWKRYGDTHAQTVEYCRARKS